MSHKNVIVMSFSCFEVRLGTAEIFSLYLFSFLGFLRLRCCRLEESSNSTNKSPTTSSLTYFLKCQDGDVSVSGSKFRSDVFFRRILFCFCIRFIYNGSLHNFFSIPQREKKDLYKITKLCEYAACMIVRTIVYMLNHVCTLKQ